MSEEEEEFMAIFGGDPADPECRPLTEEEMAEWREELGQAAEPTGRAFDLPGCAP